MCGSRAVWRVDVACIRQGLYGVHQVGLHRNAQGEQHDTGQYAPAGLDEGSVVWLASNRGCVECISRACTGKRRALMGARWCTVERWWGAGAGGPDMEQNARRAT